MVDIVPTPGRIVWYVLAAMDVSNITDRRKRFDNVMLGDKRAGDIYRIGNDVREGEIYPAMVVRVWGDKPDSYVNLQVHLDGSDVFWATSRQVGVGPGTYHWMPYQVGQAKKHAEPAA